MPYKTPWLKDKNAGIVKIRNAVGDTTIQTGNPVSVDNEFGLGEVDSLSVALNPQQNLNGYDSPWVGGAGKNKLPSHAVGSTTTNGVTFTVAEDGTVTVSGTATAATNFFLATGLSIAGGILSGCPSGGSTSSYYMNARVDGAWQTQDVGNGRTFTGTCNQVAITIANGYTANNIVFKPMIRLASETDATYESYSNICPIYASNSKNLLPSSTTQTSNGVKFTVNADGTITATRTASSTQNAEYDLTVPSSLYGKTVILNGCPSGGNDSNTYRMFFLVNGSRQATDYGNGATYTIPSSPTSCVVRINVFKTFNSTAVFKPMIRPASITDSTYVPYQSIVVTRTGKNLFNGQFAYHNADKYSPVFDGETYTVSSKSTGAHQINLQYITKTNTYYGDHKIVSEGDTFGKTTVTIPTDVKGVLIYVNGDASNAQHTAYDTQIELGSTNSAYEPFDSNTYTINLNGTRYGGTVDLVTGVLTVDRVSVDLGSLNWAKGSIGASGKYRFVAPLTGAKPSESDATASNIVSTIVRANSPTAIWDGADGITIASSSANMILRIDAYNGYTATELKTAIAGQTAVYELTTPQTVQLTAQQISLLTGINYISSSGEVTVTVTLPGWTSLIDPSKLKHDIYDLDAGNTTGRNLAGEMLRDRVAVKEKLNMEFPPMLACDYRAMLNLIKDQFFDVQYYSPFTGGKRVATMYVGDREGEPYYDYDVNDHANNMWTNVKFNFIER